ncbi:sigma-54-dependent transcriptional regulator [Variovorax terrae]|uniref:Sigma-54 dependent transcriptional regulator n=1 Tax=Variovorax terrae TaxID=2923278 RepID=A0A9X1VV43_9BURK|nr:sigma-54 dependent transcriptional regulator [Variovorax terrae]MCJ0763515.1 sigma-54 dependent transcriptional regulator [Variovorax terrae]
MFDGLKILLVDDDPAVRRAVAQTLELAGLAVDVFTTAEEALPHIAVGFRGIVLSDVRLPGMDGVQLLRRVQAVDAAIPVVLITAHGDIAMAVHAMRGGAYDFVEKPFTPERIVEAATRALEKRALSLEVSRLREQVADRRGIDSTLLGPSSVMEALRRQVRSLAATSADVMLIGETGTGKELVARCLHEHSPRRARHFVALNCGGLPDTLVESELFGHEAGAFTSAARRRVGKIEHAHGGTLLLDEIESMPMAVQVKLLRVLQERRLERLGSNEQVPVDVRVVAAAKSDLKAEAELRRFRPDLYYRLNVAVLHLPPLRERREDIPLLFEHFSMQAAARHGREPGPTPAALLQRLAAHDWPGNVRELRNVAERHVLGLGGDVLGLETARPAASLAQQINQIEKALIEQALRQHRGRASAACEALGVSRTAFYEKMARLGITIDGFRLSPSDTPPGHPSP